MAWPGVAWLHGLWALTVAAHACAVENFTSAQIFFAVMDTRMAPHGSHLSVCIRHITFGMRVQGEMHDHAFEAFRFQSVSDVMDCGSIWLWDWDPAVLQQQNKTK